MDCRELDERLFDLAAGALDPTIRDSVATHARDCPRCREEMSAYLETVRLIESLSVPKMDDSFFSRQRARVMRALSAATPSRSWEAPPWSLTALLCIVVAYLAVGLDVIGTIAGQGTRILGGDFLTGCSATLVPLYLGILALGMFTFAERESEPVLSPARRTRTR
jgi:anti-sigma factor RsiW